MTTPIDGSKTLGIAIEAVAIERTIAVINGIDAAGVIGPNALHAIPLPPGTSQSGPAGMTPAIDALAVLATGGSIGYALPADHC